MIHKNDFIFPGYKCYLRKNNEVFSILIVDIDDDNTVYYYIYDDNDDNKLKLYKVNKDEMENFYTNIADAYNF